MAARRYDLVVFGATGFTGRLVTEYLAQRAKPDGFRWAIGGRNEAKLAAIVEAINASDSVPDIVIASSDNDDSLRDLAQSTRVVISTVGPFLKYGTPLVRACVENNTHYADITGESYWVSTIIDNFASLAEENGTMVVPMCGYDSIPSDLGTFAAVEHLFKTSADAGTPLRASNVEVFQRLKGGLSGGTLLSALNLIETAPSKALSDPFLLNSEAASFRSPGFRRTMLPWWSEDMGQWTEPFIMSAVNSHVVRRSAELKPSEGYADDLCYVEVSPSKGLTRAIITSILSILIGMSLFFPPVRWAARRWGPKSGQGPTPKQRAKGKFTTTVVAQASEGTKAIATVNGGDPGYTETAKMVSEMGMLLATKADTLPGASRGGVLTPAAAFGAVAIDALNEVGVTFAIKSSL